MQNLKKNLKHANKILLRNKLDENVFMRIYSFPTENISGYIDYFDLKNRSLLTVGSSGDQILNAYFKGCRDITLIDINPFANYYINLKIAGILTFTYQEFQTFFFRWTEQGFNINRFNLDLFHKLSNNLKAIDYDSFYFFDKILTKYSKAKICDYLMNDEQSNSKIIKKFNNYLESEDSYNYLKNILKDIYFKFIFCNIFDFKSDLKFDNIFLSNLCTRIGIFELKSLLEKLNSNNLNENGSMLIAYLWDIDFESNEEGLDWKEIYRMPATRLYLKEYISEHHDVEGEYDILLDKKSKSDLVLVYKK